MIEVNWNYQTFENSKDKADPIIITQTINTHTGIQADMVDLTLDEAEFLIVELRRMIDLVSYKSLEVKS